MHWNKMKNGIKWYKMLHSGIILVSQSKYFPRICVDTLWNVCRYLYSFNVKGSPWSLDSAERHLFSLRWARPPPPYSLRQTAILQTAFWVWQEEPYQTFPLDSPMCFWNWILKLAYEIYILKMQLSSWKLLCPRNFKVKTWLLLVSVGLG